MYKGGCYRFEYNMSPLKLMLEFIPHCEILRGQNFNLTVVFGSGTFGS